MDDILSNIIFIVVLAVVGGAIYLFFRRKQAAAEQKLAQVVLAHGWKLETIREPLAWGVRIMGEAWTLEALSRSSGSEAGPGSSNVAMSTRWQADRPGSTLMLGPRLSGTALADGFVRSFVQAVTGDDLAEVALSNAALRGRYMLRAQDPAEAEAWQTPAVEEALLAWKKAAPVIKRDRSGLQMEIAGERLKNPDDLLMFIRIGEALLEAAA